MNKHKLLMTKLPYWVFLIFFVFSFVACKDDYFKENNTPEWLGSSIYDYLKNNGNYNTYVRLIDDLNYSDVLSKTGSKTLFVADDDAFERFYANNPWSVRRYEDFSMKQKRLILNSSILNNPILIENLSKIEGGLSGQAMRRTTDLAVLDTISFETSDKLPLNSYWDNFRTNGLYLAKDNTATPLLFFQETQMRAKNITDEDFKIIFNGENRVKNDAHIYNIKVKERDITCQNGYIHVLEDVLIPPSNMAGILMDIPTAKRFSSFLERFAVPYYSRSLSEQYKLIEENADSVFVKGYFSSRSNIIPVMTDASNNKYALDPYNNRITNLLLFDPGWNRYRASDVVGTFESDMGVIFAPTDQALEDYFHNGSGKAILDRYGSMEQIPDNVLCELINNHMKNSFLASIPSSFATIVDDAQQPMGIQTKHIEHTYLASNGVVYLTNTVYPPALYSSVMLPPVINENMKVFNWAIKSLTFDAYLLSMVNYYSFFIPTDNFTYIPPTSLKRNQPEAWKFRFNDVANSVYATVYAYDVQTNTIGDSITLVTNASILQDHLEDMLDYHIIVGDIENGHDFYQTKGGGTIRVHNDGNGLKVAGGRELSKGTVIPVNEIYDQSKETNGRGNGKAYIIDQPLQSTVHSVYEILSTTPEFSEFFSLLQGHDDLWVGDTGRATRFGIFYRDITNPGLDQNVRFLSTYHYTLYVPTNDEVRKAIQKGLPTWDDVEAETDQDLRDEKAEKIVRFLRYHFQDNAVFLDRKFTPNEDFKLSYETATINKNTETFYRLYLTKGSYSLNIKTASPDESNNKARVIRDNGLYNIMARDFKFNRADPQTATMIETSSYIVIHQIDKCLYFE